MLTRRVFAALAALIPFAIWRKAAPAMDQVPGQNPSPDKIAIPHRLRAAPPGARGRMFSDGTRTCVGEQFEDGYLTWLFLCCDPESDVGILRQFDKETGHLLREQLHHLKHWPLGFGNIPPEPIPSPADPKDSLRRVLDRYAKVNQEIGELKAYLNDLKIEEVQERQLALAREQAQKEGHPVAWAEIRINGLGPAEHREHERAGAEHDLAELETRCKELESLIYCCKDAAYLEQTGAVKGEQERAAYLERMHEIDEIRRKAMGEEIWTRIQERRRRREDR
jgi:hypothetical protein